MSEIPEFTQANWFPATVAHRSGSQLYVLPLGVSMWAPDGGLREAHVQTVSAEVRVEEAARWDPATEVAERVAHLAHLYDADVAAVSYLMQRTLAPRTWAYAETTIRQAYCYVALLNTHIDYVVEDLRRMATGDLSVGYDAIRRSAAAALNRLTGEEVEIDGS